MRKLVGTGSKSGAAPLSRLGDVCSQPRVWAAFAAALTLSGPRGRRAALRDVTCWARFSDDPSASPGHCSQTALTLTQLFTSGPTRSATGSPKSAAISARRSSAMSSQSPATPRRQ